MLRKGIKIAIILVMASGVVSSSSFQPGYMFSSAQVMGAGSSNEPLKAGEKYWVGGDYYFVYGFDKRPQLGTIIMKIQIFSKEGRQDDSLEITANTDMPSMRGAHATGDQPFKLSKKGDYLLPVNVVMPGEWEVVLNFLKDKKSIYTAIVRFNV